MKRTLTSLLSGVGILVAAGCSDSPGPTTFEQQSLAFADSSGSISGNVVNADSFPVRSRVLVYLVGSIPPDTTPPDTVPPDSVPPDSLPPDSLPPDTSGMSPTGYSLASLFRSDSIPVDSVPPPPPSGCSVRGRLVARTDSDRNGVFRVRGLAPGIYDIRAEAHGREGAACGTILRGGQQVFVTIIVRGTNASF